MNILGHILQTESQQPNIKHTSENRDQIQRMAHIMISLT